MKHTKGHIVTYKLIMALSSGQKFASSSGDPTLEGDPTGLEVPESSTSSRFLLLLGETAEGGESRDSETSVSVSLSEEEAADLREITRSFARFVGNDGTLFDFSTLRKRGKRDGDLMVLWRKKSTRQKKSYAI
jgi:hypothetical protein